MAGAVQDAFRTVRPLSATGTGRARASQTLLFRCCVAASVRSVNSTPLPRPVA